MKDLELDKVFAESKALLINSTEDYRIAILKAFVLCAKANNFEYLPIDTLEGIINNEKEN